MVALLYRQLPEIMTDVPSDYLLILSYGYLYACSGVSNYSFSFQCGDTFIQLYTELCKYAINIDKGNMEKELEKENLEAVKERQFAIAKTCVRMAYMLKEYDFRIAKICGLTAFSLDTTFESLNLVNRMYWTVKYTTATSDESKINPATLYEIERLLQPLRPNVLDPEFTWKKLIPLCKKYKTERDVLLKESTQYVPVLSDPAESVKYFKRVNNSANQNMPASSSMATENDSVKKEFLKEPTAVDIDRLLGNKFPRDVLKGKSMEDYSMKDLDKTINDLKKSINEETEYRKKLQLERLSVGKQKTPTVKKEPTVKKDTVKKTSNVMPKQQSNLISSTSQHGQWQRSQSYSDLSQFQTNNVSPPAAHRNTSAPFSPPILHHSNQSFKTPPAAHANHPHSSARNVISQQPVGANQPHSSSVRQSSSSEKSHPTSTTYTASDMLKQSLNNKIQSDRLKMNSGLSGSVSSLNSISASNSSLQRQNSVPNLSTGASNERRSYTVEYASSSSSPAECARIAQQIAQMHLKQRAEREKLENKKQRKPRQKKESPKTSLTSKSIPSRSQISELLSQSMKGNTQNTVERNVQNIIHIRNKILQAESASQVNTVSQANTSHLQQNTSAFSQQNLTSPQSASSKIDSNGSFGVSDQSSEVKSQKFYLTSASVIDKLKKDQSGVVNLSESKGFSVKPVFSMVVPRALTSPDNQEELVRRVTNMVKKATSSKESSVSAYSSTQAQSNINQTATVAKPKVTEHVTEEMKSTPVPDHVLEFLKNRSKNEPNQQMNRTVVRSVSLTGVDQKSAVGCAQGVAQPERVQSQNISSSFAGTATGEQMIHNSVSQITALSGIILPQSQSSLNMLATVASSSVAQIQSKNPVSFGTAASSAYNQPTQNLFHSMSQQSPVNQQAQRIPVLQPAIPQQQIVVSQHPQTVNTTVKPNPENRIRLPVTSEQSEQRFMHVFDQFGNKQIVNMTPQVHLVQAGGNSTGSIQNSQATQFQPTHGIQSSFQQQITQNSGVVNVESGFTSVRPTSSTISTNATFNSDLFSNIQSQMPQNTLSVSNTMNATTLQTVPSTNRQQFNIVPELSPAVVQQILTDLMKTGSQQDSSNSTQVSNFKGSLSGNSPLLSQSQHSKEIHVFPKPLGDRTADITRQLVQSKNTIDTSKTVTGTTRQIMSGKAYNSETKNVTQSARTVNQNFQGKAAHADSPKTMLQSSYQSVTVHDSSVPYNQSVTKQLISSASGSSGQFFSADYMTASNTLHTPPVNLSASVVASRNQTVQQSLSNSSNSVPLTQSQTAVAPQFMQVPDLPDLGRKEFGIDEILRTENSSEISIIGPNSAESSSIEEVTLMRTNKIIPSRPKQDGTKTDKITETQQQDTHEPNKDLSSNQMVLELESDQDMLKHVESLLASGTSRAVLKPQELGTLTVAEQKSRKPEILKKDAGSAVSNEIQVPQTLQNSKETETNINESKSVMPPLNNTLKLTIQKEPSQNRTFTCQSTFYNAARLAKEREEREREMKIRQEKKACPGYIGEKSTLHICGICSKIFDKQEQLKEHVKLNLCPSKTCTICETVFSSLEQLRNHLKVPCKGSNKEKTKDFEYTKIFVCSKCNFTSQNEKIGTKHVENCNVSSSPIKAKVTIWYKCHMCREVLHDKDLAYKHISRFCPQLKAVKAMKDAQKTVNRLKNISDVSYKDPKNYDDPKSFIQSCFVSDNSRTESKGSDSKMDIKGSATTSQKQLKPDKCKESFKEVSSTTLNTTDNRTDRNLKDSIDIQANRHSEECNRKTENEAQSKASDNNSDTKSSTKQHVRTADPGNILEEAALEKETVSKDRPGDLADPEMLAQRNSDSRDYTKELPYDKEEKKQRKSAQTFRKSSRLKIPMKDTHKHKLLSLRNKRQTRIQMTEDKNDRKHNPVKAVSAQPKINESTSACKLCLYSTTIDRSLARHYTQAHDFGFKVQNKRYRCKYCDVSFQCSSKIMIKGHMMKHADILLKQISKSKHLNRAHPHLTPEKNENSVYASMLDCSPRKVEKVKRHMKARAARSRCAENLRKIAYVQNPSSSKEELETAVRVVTASESNRSKIKKPLAEKIHGRPRKYPEGQEPYRFDKSSYFQKYKQKQKGSISKEVLAEVQTERNARHSSKSRSRSNSVGSNISMSDNVHNTRSSQTKAGIKAAETLGKNPINQIKTTKFEAKAVAAPKVETRSQVVDKNKFIRSGNVHEEEVDKEKLSQNKMDLKPNISNAASVKNYTGNERSLRHLRQTSVQESSKTFEHKRLKNEQKQLSLKTLNIDRQQRSLRSRQSFISIRSETETSSSDTEPVIPMRDRLRNRKESAENLEELDITCQETPDNKTAVTSPPVVTKNELKGNTINRVAMLPGSKKHKDLTVAVSEDKRKNVQDTALNDKKQNSLKDVSVAGKRHEDLPPTKEGPSNKKTKLVGGNMPQTDDVWRDNAKIIGLNRTLRSRKKKGIEMNSDEESDHEGSMDRKRSLRRKNQGVHEYSDADDDNSSENDSDVMVPMRKRLRRRSIQDGSKMQALNEKKEHKVKQKEKKEKRTDVVLEPSDDESKDGQGREIACSEEEMASRFHKDSVSRKIEKSENDSSPPSSDSESYSPGSESGDTSESESGRATPVRERLRERKNMNRVKEGFSRDKTGMGKELTLTTDTKKSPPQNKEVHEGGCELKNMNIKGYTLREKSKKNEKTKDASFQGDFQASLDVIFNVVEKEFETLAASSMNETHLVERKMALKKPKECVFDQNADTEIASNDKEQRKLNSSKCKNQDANKVKKKLKDSTDEVEKPAETKSLSVLLDPIEDNVCSDKVPKLDKNSDKSIAEEKDITVAKSKDSDLDLEYSIVNRPESVVLETEDEFSFVKSSSPIQRETAKKSVKAEQASISRTENKQAENFGSEFLKFAQKRLMADHDSLSEQEYETDIETKKESKKEKDILMTKKEKVLGESSFVKQGEIVSDKPDILEGPSPRSTKSNIDSKSKTMAPNFDAVFKAFAGVDKDSHVIVNSKVEKNLLNQKGLSSEEKTDVQRLTEDKPMCKKQRLISKLELESETKADEYTLNQGKAQRKGRCLKQNVDAGEEGQGDESKHDLNESNLKCDQMTLVATSDGHELNTCKEIVKKKTGFENAFEEFFRQNQEKQGPRHDIATKPKTSSSKDSSIKRTNTDENKKLQILKELRKCNVHVSRLTDEEINKYKKAQGSCTKQILKNIPEEIIILDSEEESQDDTEVVILDSDDNLPSVSEHKQPKLDEEAAHGWKAARNSENSPAKDSLEPDCADSEVIHSIEGLQKTQTNSEASSLIVKNISEMDTRSATPGNSCLEKRAVCFEPDNDVTLINEKQLLLENTGENLSSEASIDNEHLSDPVSAEGSIDHENEDPKMSFLNGGAEAKMLTEGDSLTTVEDTVQGEQVALQLDTYIEEGSSSEQDGDKVTDSTKKQSESDDLQNSPISENTERVLSGSRSTQNYDIIPSKDQNEPDHGNLEILTLAEGHEKVHTDSESLPSVINEFFEGDTKAITVKPQMAKKADLLQDDITLDSDDDITFISETELLSADSEGSTGLENTQKKEQSPELIPAKGLNDCGYESSEICLPSKETEAETYTKSDILLTVERKNKKQVASPRHTFMEERSSSVQVDNKFIDTAKQENGLDDENHQIAANVEKEGRTVTNPVPFETKDGVCDGVKNSDEYLIVDTQSCKSSPNIPVDESSFESEVAQIKSTADEINVRNENIPKEGVLHVCITDMNSSAVEKETEQGITESKRLSALSEDSVTFEGVANFVSLDIARSEQGYPETTETIDGTEKSYNLLSEIPGHDNSQFPDTADMHVFTENSSVQNRNFKHPESRDLMIEKSKIECVQCSSETKTQTKTTDDAKSYHNSDICNSTAEKLPLVDGSKQLHIYPDISPASKNKVMLPSETWSDSVLSDGIDHSIFSLKRTDTSCNIVSCSRTQADIKADMTSVSSEGQFTAHYTSYRLDSRDDEEATLNGPKRIKSYDLSETLSSEYQINSKKDEINIERENDIRIQETILSDNLKIEDSEHGDENVKKQDLKAVSVNKTLEKVRDSSCTSFILSTEDNANIESEIPERNYKNHHVDSDIIDDTCSGAKEIPNKAVIDASVICKIILIELIEDLPIAQFEKEKKLNNIPESSRSSSEKHDAEMDVSSENSDMTYGLSIETEHKESEIENTCMEVASVQEICMETASEANSIGSELVSDFSENHAQTSFALNVEEVCQKENITSDKMKPLENKVEEETENEYDRLVDIDSQDININKENENSFKCVDQGKSCKNERREDAAEMETGKKCDEIEVNENLTSIYMAQFTDANDLTDVDEKTEVDDISAKVDNTLMAEYFEKSELVPHSENESGSERDVFKKLDGDKTIFNKIETVASDVQCQKSPVACYLSNSNSEYNFTPMDIPVLEEGFSPVFSMGNIRNWKETEYIVKENQPYLGIRKSENIERDMLCYMKFNNVDSVEHLMLYEKSYEDKQISELNKDERKCHESVEDVTKGNLVSESEGEVTFPKNIHESTGSFALADNFTPVIDEYAKPYCVGPYSAEQTSKKYNQKISISEQVKFGERKSTLLSPEIMLADDVTECNANTITSNADGRVSEKSLSKHADIIDSVAEYSEEQTHKNNELASDDLQVVEHDNVIIPVVGTSYEENVPVSRTCQDVNIPEGLEQDKDIIPVVDISYEENLNLVRTCEDVNISEQDHGKQTEVKAVIEVGESFESNIQRQECLNMLSGNQTSVSINANDAHNIKANDALNIVEGQAMLHDESQLPFKGGKKSADSELEEIKAANLMQAYCDGEDTVSNGHKGAHTVESMVVEDEIQNEELREISIQEKQDEMLASDSMTVQAANDLEAAESTEIDPGDTVTMVQDYSIQNSEKGYSPGGQGSQLVDLKEITSDTHDTRYNMNELNETMSIGCNSPQTNNSIDKDQGKELHDLHESKENFEAEIQVPFIAMEPSKKSGEVNNDSGNNFDLELLENSVQEARDQAVLTCQPVVDESVDTKTDDNKSNEKPDLSPSTCVMEEDISLEYCKEKTKGMPERSCHNRELLSSEISELTIPDAVSGIKAKSQYQVQDEPVEKDEQAVEQAYQASPNVFNVQVDSNKTADGCQVSMPAINRSSDDNTTNDLSFVISEHEHMEKETPAACRGNMERKLNQRVLERTDIFRNKDIATETGLSEKDDDRQSQSREYSDGETMTELAKSRPELLIDDSHGETLSKQKTSLTEDQPYNTSHKPTSLSQEATSNEGNRDLPYCKDTVAIIPPTVQNQANLADADMNTEGMCTLIEKSDRCRRYSEERPGDIKHSSEEAKELVLKPIADNMVEESSIEEVEGRTQSVMKTEVRILASEAETLRLPKNEKTLLLQAELLSLKESKEVDSKSITEHSGKTVVTETATDKKERSDPSESKTFKDQQLPAELEEVDQEEIEEFNKRTENVKKSLKKCKGKPYQSDFNFEVDDDTLSTCSSSSSGTSLSSHGIELDSLKVVPGPSRTVSPFSGAEFCSSPQKHTVSTMTAKIGGRKTYCNRKNIVRKVLSDTVKSYPIKAGVKPGNSVQSSLVMKLVNEVPDKNIIPSNKISGRKVSLPKIATITNQYSKFSLPLSNDPESPRSVSSESNSGAESVDSGTKDSEDHTLHPLRAFRKLHDVTPFTWDLDSSNESIDSESKGDSQKKKIPIRCRSLVSNTSSLKEEQLMQSVKRRFSSETEVLQIRNDLQMKCLDKAEVKKRGDKSEMIEEGYKRLRSPSVLKQSIKADMGSSACKNCSGKDDLSLKIGSDPSSVRETPGLSTKNGTNKAEPVQESRCIRSSRRKSIGSVESVGNLDRKEECDLVSITRTIVRSSNRHVIDTAATDSYVHDILPIDVDGSLIISDSVSQSSSESSKLTAIVRSDKPIDTRGVKRKSCSTEVEILSKLSVESGQPAQKKHFVLDLVKSARPHDLRQLSLQSSQSDLASDPNAKQPKEDTYKIVQESAVTAEKSGKCSCQSDSTSDICEECTSKQQSASAKNIKVPYKPLKPAVRRLLHGGKVFEIQKGSITETDIASSSANQTERSRDISPQPSELRKKTRLLSSSPVDTSKRKKSKKVKVDETGNLDTSLFVKTGADLNEYIHATLEEIRKQRQQKQPVHYLRQSQTETEAESKWKLARKDKEKKYPYSFKRSRPIT